MTSPPVPTPRPSTAAPRTIAQKADVVATFRHVSVFLMETLARWTPTTAQLEAKILFGRHLWELAQHADALGQRTAELRASLHYTRAPLAAYRDALDAVAGAEDASERIHGMYDALIPDLIARYHAFEANADPLLDQPTTRIVERIVADLVRLGRERHEILAEATLPATTAAAAVAGRLRARLAAIGEIVDFRPIAPIKEVRA